MSEKCPPQSFVPLDALNAVYSLCLAVILTFAFHFDETSKSVEPAIKGITAWLVFLYGIYFVLDWVTANANRNTVTAQTLVLNMVFIPVLTVAILLLFSASDLKFLVISVYALVVAIRDGYVIFAESGNDGFDRVVLQAIVAALRTAVAFFILVPVTIGLFGRSDVFSNNRDWFLSLSMALVFLKYFRLVLIRGQHSNS